MSSLQRYIVANQASFLLFVHAIIIFEIIENLERTLTHKMFQTVLEKFITKTNQFFLIYRFASALVGSRNMVALIYYR